MKKKRNLLFVAMLFLLSSCVTFHSGLTSNLNNHTTEVVLSQNNYTVISSVKGEASAVGAGAVLSPPVLILTNK